MERHPDTDELLTFLETLSNEEARGTFTHLLGCPSCARLALDVLQGQRDGSDWGNVLDFRVSDLRVSSAFERVWDEHFADADAERHESPGLLRELLSVPASQRRDRVQNDSRYRTWALADYALGTACPIVALDATRGRDQIELGLGIAETLDEATYGKRLLADLEARGRSLLGEARRRLGDLKGAERAFSRARAALARSVDPAETARFEHLLGLLRRDQGRLPEAQEHLEQAVAIYGEVGDRERSARPLASLGITELLGERLEAAETRLRHALDRLDEETRSLPRLLVQYHLILVLVELERFPEARRVCTETLPLLAEWPQLEADPRVTWVHGWLSSGIGHAEDAIRSLQMACDRLREQRPKVPFVLAAFDLAVLLSHQGRWKDLESLSREIEVCSEAARLTGAAGRAVEFLVGLDKGGRKSREDVRQARQAARPARIQALTLGDPI